MKVNRSDIRGCGTGQTGSGSELGRRLFAVLDSKTIRATLRSVAVLGLCLLVIGTLGVAVGAADGTESTPEEDDRQVLLVYFDDQPTDGQDIDALEERARTSQEPLVELARETPGIAIERQFWLVNAVAVSVDAARVDPAILADVAGVRTVEPNANVRSLSIEDAGRSDSASSTEPRADARIGSTAALDGHTSYGINQINADDTWEEFDTRGEGITVAVLDTGVDPEHPDIDVAGWGDWDKRGNALDTEPHEYDVHREPSGHGTHVSGIVVAGDESGIHLGVAPDAELMVGAVMTDCDESGCDATEGQILAGMEWAIENDADVICISIGLDGKHSDFIHGIRIAQDAGITVIASVGNDGEGTSSSPGNEYDPISVGGSDPNGEILSLSGGGTIDTDDAWGSSAPDDWPEEYVIPTVTAPGGEIWSTVRGGQYAQGSGTSQAAPHVAGAAALVQAATDEELSPAAIEHLLVDTASTPDGKLDEPNARYGHGIINVYKATEAAIDGEYDVEDDADDAGGGTEDDVGGGTDDADGGTDDDGEGSGTDDTEDGQSGDGGEEIGGEEADDDGEADEGDGSDDGDDDDRGSDGNDDGTDSEDGTVDDDETNDEDGTDDETADGGADDDGGDDETDDETGEEDGDGTPGFGVLVGGAALAIGLGRRLRTSDR